MSSAHAHLPEYRFYGSAALRRSRDGAAALTGCIIALSAAGLFAVTAGKTILTTPSAPPAMMIMRVMEDITPPDPLPVNKELQKILAEDSEFTISKPPELAPPEPDPLPEPLPPDPIPQPKPKPEPAPEPKPKPVPKKEAPRRKQPPAPVREASREAAAVNAPAGEISGSSASAAAVAERKTEGELRDKLLARLTAEIEKRKSYPRQARRTGAEGTSTLEIRVDASGVIQSCGLAKGCGSPTLDAATKRLGEKLVGLNTGVTGGAFRVLVPVTYSLRDR